VQFEGDHAKMGLCIALPSNESTSCSEDKDKKLCIEKKEEKCLTLRFNVKQTL
jgi:hypothetical protein